MTRRGVRVILGGQMIVLLEREGVLTLRRVRVRERLVARLRASALDDALIEGASPESSVPLALHAQHVSAPTQRRLLACSLRRIVAAAEAQTPRHRGAPLNREAVRRARSGIESLADRLASDEPVDARGVARVRALLSDGTGALYRPSQASSLDRELVAVSSAIDPPS
jgi:hypothetical protein